MQEVCPTEVGDLLAERFEILDKGRAGGMSWVVKAKDVRTGRFCAVKLPKQSGDSELNSLAFNRECDALNSLSHENIVGFLDAGRDNDGRQYLAIEWLQQSLSDKILKNPPWDWESFYMDIGRPLLIGLAHAHLRGVAHRDLKPDNLLFDSFNTIKICDFGIATAVSRMNYGRTLRHAGSIPYTPPEADNGVKSESRDAYSWAVVATSCLAGKLFTDLGSFQASLQKLDRLRNPLQLLEKAASMDPSRRFYSAIDLLVETDAFHKSLTDQQQITVALELSGKALKLVSAHWLGTESIDLGLLVQKDLNATRSAQFMNSDEVHIRLVGATLEVICRKISLESPCLRVEEVNILGVDRAEMMRRDIPNVSGVSFFVCDYQAALPYSKQLRMFNMRLRVAESELERDIERKTRERWLDCWSAFLREKERYGRERKEKYNYSRMRRSGQIYYATCDGEMNPDDVAESLIILNEGGPLLLFKVVDVLVDHLVLELQGNYHDLVPLDGGTLESNHVASRRAILRQRGALEMVKRDGAVSPDLKKILCDASLAQPPEMSGHSVVATDLSPDKHELVEFRRNLIHLSQ